MNILVIGGTGFLGRAIVEQLVYAHIDCTVLTRSPEKMARFSKPLPYIVGDLLEYENLDLTPFQYIINCSGELKNRALMQSLHVDALQGLLLRVHTSSPKIHWLQISSVGVYGAVKKNKIMENEPFSPQGTYEITKADGELLIKNFCEIHNMSYTIIRPSNVFGCDMPNQSLAQLITMIKKGLFFYISKTPQTIAMNYVPVEDVAHFVCCCINNPAAINQDFIISDYISQAEFVEIVCAELKLKNSFLYVPELLIRLLAKLAYVIPRFPLTDSRVDALTIKTIYSTEKAQSRLAFSPSMGLKQGLKKYINYLYKK
ncbi:MAG: NAD(P)-dependent oxidoreductase [bacterium]|nr:NAD(P)-dependent oxidoreductase [bacterium]